MSNHRVNLLHCATSSQAPSLSAFQSNLFSKHVAKLSIAFLWQEHLARIGMTQHTQAFLKIIDFTVVKFLKVVATTV